MRKIYSLSVMCILLITSFAQIQSNCESTSQIEYYYTNDVADLAINRMFEINSTDTSLIEIPQIYIDSIWNGLSAIFNATSIPERDSVFDIYCIHNIAFQTTMLFQYIGVSLDTNFAWTSNWLNGEIVTGYTELDEFISNYNYSIFTTYPLSSGVSIYSDSIINSNAVCDSLISFNGIDFAHPQPTALDGNKIQYYAEGDYQYFTFTKAWGDCLAGCIFYHKWNFKVHYSNCTVEYLGLETNTNNNLPNPINCNITAIDDKTSASSEIVIFPNPAGSRISIEGKDIQSIKVFNKLGLLLNSIDQTRDKTTLNIEYLKPGIYFLSIERRGATINEKFIKN